MSPVVVHRARHLVEATLLARAIEQAGVRATVLGEHRAGLVGGVAQEDTLVDVVVDGADVSRAQAAVRRFFGPQLVLAPWTCPTCGETNPGNFELCWRCDEG